MASMTAVRPQNLFGPMLGLTGLAEAIVRSLAGARDAGGGCRSIFLAAAAWLILVTESETQGRGGSLPICVTRSWRRSSRWPRSRR